MAAERLKTAYQSVSFFADETWFPNDLADNYISTNRALWIRECNLRYLNGDFKSVLDTIPDSWLAKYGTYFYNITRENSYIRDEFPESPSVRSFGEENEIEEECWNNSDVEQIFQSLLDVNAKTSELEQKCKDILHLKDSPLPTIAETEASRADNISTISDDDNQLLSLGVFQNQISKFPLYAKPPKGNITTYDELKLQIKLHSHTVRSLWPDQIRLPIAECYPLYESQAIVKMVEDEFDSLLPSFNELNNMVDNIIVPTSSSSSCRDASWNDVPSGSASVSPMLGNLLLAKVPGRRLYSDVLQNVTTTDKLESEALEQYKPEYMNSPSHDSILSAKFCELEQMALEQYNNGEQSATENAIEVEGLNVDTTPTIPPGECSVATGNELPTQEPPCGAGGQTSPSAAMLLASSVSVLVNFYHTVANTELLSSYLDRLR